MRDNLRNHFGVLNGDGEVLLLDGLPIHPAELVNLTEKVADFLHPEDGILRRSAGEYLVQLNLDREEVVPAAIGAVSGVIVQQEFVVTQFDISAAEGHQAGVSGIESNVITGLGLVDGDDVERHVDTHTHQHIRDLFRVLLAHRLVVVDDDPLGLCVGCDEGPEGFADALYYAVEVVILIAVKTLEDTVVVKAEGAADVAFTYLLGLEGTHSNDEVAVASVVLELPGNTVNLCQEGGGDIRQVELECTLGRIVFVDDLGRDFLLKEDFL